MVLHREGGAVGERDAAIRAVEQRDMRFLRIGRQRRAIYRKTMVHRDNFNLVGGEILDRMVRAMVALMHFQCFGTNGERHDLVPEADAECRNALFDQHTDGGNCISPRRRRITGPVRQKNAVWF